MGTHTTRITLTLSRRQAMLAGVLTGTVILLFRSWLEADMARHMLVEFPLLLVAGLATAKALPERTVARIMRSNQMGLAGFTFVSLIAAYWMIPVALDQALSSGPAAGAKYASFLAAGMLLPVSFQAAPLAMQAFFVGNWVSKYTATALRELSHRHAVEHRRGVGRGRGRHRRSLVRVCGAGVSRYESKHVMCSI